MPGKKNFNHFLIFVIFLKLSALLYFVLFINIYDCISYVY